MPSLRVDPPLKRPLKIFAFDPMRGRDPLTAITVEVENERLAPGPSGSRVRVADYDGTADRYLAPVDLDDPAVLMAGGLDPSESDPRFHQQMVYAVTMKVLENFDRALDRRLDFRGRQLLRVPHAFPGTNAFYDPSHRAIFFGHFPADTADQGTKFDPEAGERELHPDLVDRVAEIAAESAQTILTMCIRAFEYLPPLDITFGDFLRALITADRDLLAEDGADQRRVMIEAFRKRGIYPAGVISLSEGSLCWPELHPVAGNAGRPAVRRLRRCVPDRLPRGAAGADRLRHPLSGPGPRPIGEVHRLDPRLRPLGRAGDRRADTDPAGARQRQMIRLPRRGSGRAGPGRVPPPHPGR